MKDPNGTEVPDGTTEAPTASGRKAKAEKVDLEALVAAAVASALDGQVKAAVEAHTAELQARLSEAERRADEAEAKVAARPVDPEEPTVYARLLPYRPAYGQMKRRHSITSPDGRKTFRFEQRVGDKGSDWVEVPATIGKRLAETYNPTPKGAARGANAFEVVAELPRG